MFLIFSISFWLQIDLEVDKKRKTKKGVQIKSKEEKRQIRRAKEKEKKMKKKKGGNSAINNDEEDEEKEFATNERVAFNEVAHAPPTKLAGFANSLAERRPGQKSNLLLAQKLKSKKDSGVSLARQKVLADEREKSSLSTERSGTKSTKWRTKVARNQGNKVMCSISRQRQDVYFSVFSLVCLW